MRMFLGGLMAFAGFVAGAWAGIIWGLVGGIEEAIRAFSASPVNAGDAAWGLTRCVFLWEFIGITVFLVFFLPGIKLMRYDSSRKTKATDRKFAAKHGERWFTK